MEQEQLNASCVTGLDTSLNGSIIEELIELVDTETGENRGLHDMNQDGLNIGSNPNNNNNNNTNTNAMGFGCQTEVARTVLISKQSNMGQVVPSINNQLQIVAVIHQSAIFQSRLVEPVETDKQEALDDSRPDFSPSQGQWDDWLGPNNPTAQGGGLWQETSLDEEAKWGRTGS
ncbi:hypothetical protein NDU88_004709 [Pleurodeles waltl]|uniref:Uncharacterized protein n=1 Tax=Pleurodeles waltl TaxID=8319 RepID=A0AAV7L076_PLEWA|nr:hypothetical protein NDU88_004709 [Pleurodeles waltl]